MSLSHRVTELMERSYNRDSDSFSFQNRDGAGRVAMNSIFGENVVGQRIPFISAQFMYGFDSRAARDQSLNGGTITIDESMLSVNSGTESNGTAIIQSKEAVRYIPGHETYAFFTVVFDEPAVGNTMKAGLFEQDNGYWIGYKDDVFGFCRLRDGVENFIPASSFDVDILNGNNQYNFTINPQYGNVYKVSYGYLGFAPIVLEVQMPHGEWMRVHTIDYPNMNTVTHIRNTYLTLRAESVNDGNTTNKSLKIGSVSAGIIDGGSNRLTGRDFSQTIPVTATGTNTMLALFRNKATFNGTENHVDSKLLRLSITTAGAQEVTLQILKDTVITNTPTWIDVDTDNSTHEYSTDATLSLTNARQLIAFELTKTQNYVEKVIDYDLILYAGETAAFVANGTNNVKMTINWTERF